MNRQDGVTLIELMIGLAVLALLLMMAAPSYGVWLANTRVRNAAESIQNGLRLARNEAVQRGVNVRFELTSTTDASWQVCALAAASDTCATKPFVPIQTYNAAGGAANVVVGSEKDTSYATGKFDTPLTSVASSSVVFNSLGRPNDYGGTAIVRIDASSTTSGSRRLVTVLGVGGSLRMCDPDPQLSSATNPQACL